MYQVCGWLSAVAIMDHLLHITGRHLNMVHLCQSVSSPTSPEAKLSFAITVITLISFCYHHTINNMIFIYSSVLGSWGQNPVLTLVEKTG